MAKVKIQGNASGTGTLTLTAPNTNADRTITLPDGTGELLAKDSSGNLGIGTSSPSYPLDVYASGTAGIRVDAGNGWSNLHLKSSNPAGGGGSIYFENNSGTNIAQIFAYQNYSSPYMSLYVNNSEKMRIDSSGNVGIGTSSPAEKLDVNGSIKMANGYNLTWGDIYSNGAPTIYAVDSASSASNYIHISPKGNATSASGGVRINSAGNVGIGTDSPSEALDVSRSVNNDFTTLKISNTYGSTTANGSGTSLQFYGWDAGVTADIKSVRENQAYSPSYLSFETFGGNGNTGSNTLAERMRIDGYGNVGIGTSSPNAMLHVQGAGNVYGGNIQIGSGVVNTAKWSMITGAHYNEAKGICMMACYTDASSNVVHIGGDPYEANPATSINFHTHTSSTHTLGGTERMRIDSAGRVTMPYQPAFEVNITGSHAHGALTPTWGASWEVGSNVSTTNKRFTAPVAGTYHFDSWIGYQAAWTANRVIIYLSVNGSDRVSHQNYRSGLDTGINLSANFRLEAGDYVGISLYQDSGATRVLQPAVQWAGFGGYLIG